MINEREQERNIELTPHTIIFRQTIVELLYHPLLLYHTYSKQKYIQIVSINYLRKFITIYTYIRLIKALNINFEILFLHF